MTHAEYMRDWRKRQSPEWFARHSEYQRRYREKNAAKLQLAKKAYHESTTPRVKWERHLKNRYGITAADYEALHTAQCGKCAICRGASRRLRLSVDHCHKTGKVRGLLCERCNSLLGRVEDRPEILESAALYLRAAK